jgi:hypothetical protein
LSIQMALTFLAHTWLVMGDSPSSYVMSYDLLPLTLLRLQACSLKATIF